MTAAYNLSQLANRVNTSGQIDASTALTGSAAVANGGTGAATLAANNVLLGNGTSALQTVAPGTAGSVLTSNGTTWISSAGAASNGRLIKFTVLTASGTFTKQASTAFLFAQLVGGGGPGGAGTATASGAGGQAGGGAVFQTATPSSTYAVNIGAAGANTTMGGVTAAGGIAGTTGFFSGGLAGSFGASSNFGSGGAGGVTAAGSAGTGNGAAGGGGGSNGFAGFAGGAGTLGVIYVWEYS